MFYHEEKMDLLEVPQDYLIAHCISGDMALGAGVAKQIADKWPNIRSNLFTVAKWECRDTLKPGSCYMIDRICNLVTKEKCYHKPTLDAIKCALEDLVVCMLDGGYRQVAMPMIGCGLDKQSWEDVFPIIVDAFRDTDIEVMVCKL